MKQSSITSFDFGGTFVKALISALLLVSLVSCQSNDSSPVSGVSHPVTLSTGTYTTAGLMNYLVPSAYAAVSELKVCFKRLRFKSDINDASTVNGNINFDLGEVVLTNSGNLLGSVNVPAGTYYRVEFDLEPTCASGNSMSLANDFGVFTSQSTMTIKFDGVFIVDGTEILELGVQDILNAANAYNGVGLLKDAMESASGTL